MVKAALGAVSDAGLTNASILGTDEAIGQTLAGDTYLETLPASALITIIQTAMAGIDGSKGKSQAAGPEAAEEFVQGLLSISGTVPDNIGYPAFAVGALKKVSSNTSVDELVAYQVGLADNATTASLAALASALYTSYPSAIAKVTQGLSAVLPASDATESARVSFIQQLTAAQTRDAVPILQGALFVDPYNAGPFTQGVFSTLLSQPNGSRLLVSDAPRIATGAGAILGQDGDALTQVADIFSQYIANDDLPVSDAATYATALISGAVKGRVPGSQFSGAAFGGGGGDLNVGAGIDAETATDLASIVDLLASGVIIANHFSLGTASGLRSTASEIGSMAGDVARYVKDETFDDGGSPEPAAVYLAGTLADSVATTVAELNLEPNVQNAILAAIETDVAADTNGAVRADVKAVFENDAYRAYPVVGAISPQETMVTNL